MAFEQPVYNIWIRGIDPNPTQPTKLERLALVTDYVKLEFKSRYNDVGGWTLLMRDGTEQANLLRKLLVGSSTDPQGQTSSGRGYGGITVVRNGTIVFSGPVRGFVATGDENDGSMIEFHGCDDNGYLSSRICMVQKNGVGQFDPPSQQGYGYYVYPDTTQETRHMSEVISNLVLNNLVNNGNNTCPADRYIPFLTVPAAGYLGPNGRTRARYQNLLAKCQEAATYVVTDPKDAQYIPGYRGLQFYIKQTKEDTLACVIREPLDQSGTVVLSLGSQVDNTAGNIGTYKYSLDAPTVNFAVLGGQEETTNRWFAYKGSGYSPSAVALNSLLTYGRWEGFIDRRDIQYSKPVAFPPNANYEKMLQEFIQALDTELRDEGEITNLEVTAINTGNTRYFETYNLGDVITVRLQGQDIVAQVTDATVTLTKEEGEVVVPNIGTQVIGSTTRLFNYLYKTGNNIRNLNTR